MTVPLHGAKAAGRVALIDDEDFEVVCRYRWFLWEDRKRNGGPYAMANMPRLAGVPPRGAQTMHKLLTGWPRTDHINHDGLDNQRHNLRPATGRQNQWNRLPGRNRNSPYKGVSLDERCLKWRARISIEGKERWLGHFKTDIEAARAYDAAAREAFGEWACLNFPDS